MNFCEICGRPAECKHHLIFGFAMRKLADEDGLVIDMCNQCHNIGKYQLHNHPVASQLSKMLGQERWEKQRIIEGATQEQAREQFIKRYGRSWL